MRRVALSGVSMELPESHPSVTLQEIEPPYRDLRIPIGLVEGVAIAYAWRGIEAPRPLTHDLFSNVLRLLQASLEVMEITGVENRTFLARLIIVSGASKHEVPCRPSDGIALVLRQTLPVPMLVDEDLLGPTA